jgi:hypothetical protein
MARPRPTKKSEPAPSAEHRVLPMELQVGDRLTDETGEWEVTVRPYTSPGGKNVHARVRRIDQPATAEERTWGAHERISVKRTASPPSAPGSTGSC